MPRCISLNTFAFVTLSFDISNAFIQHSNTFVTKYSQPLQHNQARTNRGSSPPFISVTIDEQHLFSSTLFSSSSDTDEDADIYEDALGLLPEGLSEYEPIPFFSAENNQSFIECYADSVAKLDGVEYTIATPCDNPVALCYFGGEDNDELQPIELDDEMMDDVFSVAQSIVDDEFGEELVLERTPQTLTLIGELEEGEDGDDRYQDDEDDDGGLLDEEEEVEILLSFEFEGMEVNLVKILDPVLLVGKTDPENELRRILLTPEESEAVLPALEELYLKKTGADKEKKGADKENKK